MQTSFSLDQLADPATGEAERILRTCVHCGFCQSSCPTYALLGDERDSPRGRIYLIKDMLEQDRAVVRYASQAFWLDVGHVDDYRAAQESYSKHFATLKEQTG